MSDDKPKTIDAYKIELLRRLAVLQQDAEDGPRTQAAQGYQIALRDLRRIINGQEP